jgi:hypothetical protein
MSTSSRVVRDGISLVGSYYFVLAGASLIGTCAIVVYAALPPLEQRGPDLAQALFPPIIGLLIGFLLSLLYGTVGIGLMRVSNSARMGAIFLAMFGVVGGLLVVLGTVLGSISALVPDWLRISGIGAATFCIYGFLTFVDILVLGFLLHPRVRAEFYGIEWVPEMDELDEPEQPVVRPSPQPAGGRGPGGFPARELASSGD